MSDSTDRTVTGDVDRHFAETVVQKGLLSQSQIDALRESQVRLRKKGQERTLAEIATEKTLLTRSQADEIVRMALPSAVPKEIGNYEIIEKIGAGGMGAVYKARHRKLDSYAAVKFLPADLAHDGNFVQRFEREARLAAQLNSPYSVRTFDVAEAEGARAIIMEFVEGESLEDLLQRERRLDEKKALRIIHDVASALEEAHELGIIHRDIKPGNILLTRRGVPKLADLGLAKNVEQGNVTLTSLVAVLLSPSYMSPEQAMGLPDLDNRSDIYSLGATLYRMTVGELPFTGETPVNVMHKIATEPLVAPLTRNPSLSEPTAAVICKMMAKQREERYQSLADVKTDIERILAGEQTGLDYKSSASLLDSGATRTVSVRRKPRAVLVGALVVLGVVIAGGVFFVTTRYTAPGRAARPGRAERTSGPADLLSSAQRALALNDHAEARRLCEDLIAAFPKSAEKTGAESLLKDVEREEAFARLMQSTARGEISEAQRLLQEAQQRWAGDPRVAGLQATVGARVETDYREALARGAASEQSGDFAAAVAAYRRAAALREGEEVQERLANAEARGRISEAATLTDVSARLAALADALGAARSAGMKEQARALNEVLGARSRGTLSVSHAERFAERMSPPVRASAALARKRLEASDERAARLDAQRLDLRELEALRAAYAEVADLAGKAASDTFDALYPGLDEDLGGRDPAGGFVRLWQTRETYGDYPRIAALQERHDPDGACMAVAGVLVGTKARPTDYASPAQAREALGRLDAALAQCERMSAEGPAKVRADALKGALFLRRAAAQEAAGAPVEALADASAAMAANVPREDCAALMADAARHFVQGFAEALNNDDRVQAHQTLLELRARLVGEAGADARAAIVAASSAGMTAGAFRTLMRDQDLTKAWTASVGGLVPPGTIAIPAGRFPLGVKHEGLVALAPNNSPEHVVALHVFCIAPHEVTNAQFKEFVDDGGYADERWWGDAQGVDRAGFVDETGKPGPRFWRDQRFADGADRLPVTGVSWYEAAAYARWAGLRLPTEAEWECAALGVPAQDGEGEYSKQKFPWGNAYEKGCANVDDAGVNAPEPVGTRPRDRSPLGCFDMTGNVREWTASPFAPYPDTQCKDKAFDQDLFTVRGACFADSYIGALPTARRATDRRARDLRTGFRCAWSPPTD